MEKLNIAEILKDCPKGMELDCTMFDNVTIPFSVEKNYELVPNKFDITTFKPFENRVLIRDDSYGLWRPSIWGFYDKEQNFPYVTIAGRNRQCIPYDGNEHLLGTTDDCDEYYKTWE